MIDLNRSRLCWIDRRFPRCSDRGPPCAGVIFCILFWKCFFCESIADLNRFRSCCMHQRFSSCLYLRCWIRRHLTWFILSSRWVSSFRWRSRTFFTISRLNDIYFKSNLMPGLPILYFHYFPMWRLCFWNFYMWKYSRVGADFLADSLQIPDKYSDCHRISDILSRDPPLSNLSFLSALFQLDF